MTIDLDQLVQMLRAELAAIPTTALRARVDALLVNPVEMRCAWDYGDWVGEPDQVFPCWKVAAQADWVAIVHCGQGFGPKCPWGLVDARDPIPSMGQDSGWFPSFRDAADVLGLLPAVLGVGLR